MPLYNRKSAGSVSTVLVKSTKTVRYFIEEALWGFFSPTIYTETPPAAAVTEVSPGLSFRLGPTGLFLSSGAVKQQPRALSGPGSSQQTIRQVVVSAGSTPGDLNGSREHSGQSGSVILGRHGTSHRQGKQHSGVSLPSAQEKSSKMAPILQGAKPSVCIRKDVAMKTELLWKHVGVQVSGCSECQPGTGIRAQ